MWRKLAAHTVDLANFNINEFDETLYRDTELADFILISADGKEFPVHRFALALKSKFFKSMFMIDMKEKELRSVVFEDINSATLEKALMFIYTDKTDKTEIADYKFAIDLIYAAEKFALENLKMICAAALRGRVDCDSVIEIFTAADMFNVAILEERCFDFIFR